jgi:uncharacterized RDD family membrane protein YckC
MAQDDDNPYAAPESDVAPERFDRQRRDRYEYGDILQRFVAFFVDGLILVIPNIVIQLVAGGVIAAAGESDAAGPLAIIMGLGAFVAQMVVQWLYNALQESSEAQATLGKRLMGLIVVNTDGDRLTFGQASGRFFGKLLSMAICYIGFLIQPFNDKKQALHDMLASTLVIKK